MSEDYESVLLVKHEVFVYRIPPLASSRGHKAADWKLDNPDYVCRLRVVSRGEKLELKLDDKSSGELFAKCPIDKYPGTAVEPVVDSSRYFVIRLQDDSGRTAVIGIGFADRSDSFDMNVALQDHFRYLGKIAKLSDEQAQGISNQPKLDLKFKEGQTITLNIGKKDTGDGSPSGNATSRPRSAGTGNIGGPVPLLPPPPSAGSRVVASAQHAKGRSSPAGAGLQQQQRQATGSGAAASFNPFLSSGAAGETTPKAPNALLDFDAFTSNLPSVPPKAPSNPFIGSSANPEASRGLTQQSGGTATVGNLLDL